MNNRDYKQFAAGEYYHLYNRGNGKMNIFRDRSDYDFLLSRLEEYLDPKEKTIGTIAIAGTAMMPIVKRRKTFPRDAFSLVCYCLMPNHFHFLIRQNADVPLSTLMLNLWSGYSKYFNRKYERVGSLFQDQFKAVLVDNDQYLKWLSAYIHQNPTVASITRLPEEYQFSSYREYISIESGGLCRKEIVLEQFPNARAYQDFVSESLSLIRKKKELEEFLIDYA